MVFILPALPIRKRRLSLLGLCFLLGACSGGPVPQAQAQQDILQHALVLNCQAFGLTPQLDLGGQEVREENEVLVSGELSYTGERKSFRSEIAHENYCWSSPLTIQARYTQQGEQWRLEELEAIPSEAQREESQRALKAYN